MLCEGLHDSGFGAPYSPGHRSDDEGIDVEKKALSAALDYLPRWIEHQMRLVQQPGCSIAVAHQGRVVLEIALGLADERRGVPLTPRHRCRVASHSKTFTAAGVLRLWDQGRWQLDDAVGRYVGGLHPEVARTTLAQLLSHGAGLVRDGADASQWAERRPFLDEAELRAGLALAPTIAPNSRFKYSNHGYGLAGLAIEAVTGERYVDWIAREVVAASALEETLPDVPLPRGTPVAHGHSSRLPLGRRLVVPATMSTHSLASATGFVSTPGDLARFFASLAPDAKRSVLSVAARREMTRRHRKDPQTAVERGYGLGLFTSTSGGWEWFGHSGSFPGTLSRTIALPGEQLALSIVTNAADGPAQAWVDGAVQILQAHARHGAPSRRTAAWTGRWWSLWGAFDLVPVGDRVLLANPSLANPLLDASEIVPHRRDREGTLHGLIASATGLMSHGEPARLEHDGRGRPKAFWHGGTKLLPEGVLGRELERRYG
jgi:D-alanyl-D-alanine carboxypeptidase